MQNHFSNLNFQTVYKPIEKVSLRKKVSLPDQVSNINSKVNNRQQSVPTASTIKSLITYSFDDSQSKFTLRQCTSQVASRQDIEEKSRVSCRSKISLKSLGQQSKNKVKWNKSTNRVVTTAIKLNLKYSDIMAKNNKSYMFEFAKRFCSVRGVSRKHEQKNLKEGLLDMFDFGSQKQNFGCKCELKCSTIERWLAQNGNYCSKYQKFSKDDYKTHMSQIQKDLRRTQPFEKTFSQQSYIKILKQTLSAYAMTDPQLGYTQGMNFIASVFVYHSPDLVSCIKLMDIFFKRKNYRSIYVNNFLQCKRHVKLVNKILERKCNDMFIFFMEHEIQLSIFIEGWFISLLANVIPLQSMHLVIDLFLNQSFRGIYKLICTLLMYIYEMKTLYLFNDSGNIMEILSFQGLNNCGIDWEQVLSSSNNFPLSLNDLKRIEAEQKQ